MTETQKKFEQMREYLKSPEFAGRPEDERKATIKEYLALRRKLDEEKGATP